MKKLLTGLLLMASFAAFSQSPSIILGINGVKLNGDSTIFNGNFAKQVLNAVATGGNVGIGTTTPTAALDLVGKLKVSNTTAPITLENEGFGSDFTGLYVGANRVAVYDNISNVYQFGQNIISRDNNGTIEITALNGVGINNPSPTAALDVVGDQKLTGGLYFGTGGQNISRGSFDNSTSSDNGIGINSVGGYELNWQRTWLTSIKGGIIQTLNIKSPVHIDSNLTVRGTISDSNGVVGRPYKVYTFLASQSGVDEPNITFLENTIGGIVWSYSSLGIYNGTLAGAFTDDKTFFIYPDLITTGIGADKGGLLFKIFVYRVDNNTIRIYTSRSDRGNADDILYKTSIEVRVYN